MAGVVKTLALAAVGTALGHKVLATKKELQLALASAQEAREIVAFLTAEVSELKQARKVDKRALDGLAARCSEADALVQRRDERVRALVADLARLRRELTEAHRAGTEKEARHAEEMRALNEQMSALLGKLKVSEAKTVAISSQSAKDIATLTAQVEAATARYASVQQDNESLAAQVEQVKAASTEISAKLCASEADNARLLKTVVEQDKEISKLQLLIKSLEAENLRLTQAALTKAAEPNRQSDTAALVRTPDKQASTCERAPTEAPEAEEPTPLAEEAPKAEAEEPTKASQDKEEATLNAVRRFTLRATAPAFKPTAATESTPVEPTPPAPVALVRKLKLNPCAAPFVPLRTQVESSAPPKACVERAVATITTKPALSLMNEATEVTEAPKPAGETQPAPSQGLTAAPTPRALPEQPAPSAPLLSPRLAPAPDNAAPAPSAAPAPAKPGGFFAVRPVPPPCPRCLWIFERRQEDPNDR